MATHCGIIIGRGAALRPLKDELSDISGVQEETSAGSVSWATLAGKSNVPKKIAWTKHAVKKTEEESQEGAKIYNIWKDLRKAVDDEDSRQLSVWQSWQQSNPRPTNEADLERLTRGSTITTPRDEETFKKRVGYCDKSRDVEGDMCKEEVDC
jgi:hypothetical protein